VVFGLLLHPSLETQSSLERDTIKGDSPVEESKMDLKYVPEYCILNTMQE